MATPVIASAGSARQELNHPAEIVSLFQRLGLRAPKYHNKLANFHKCYIEKNKSLDRVLQRGKKAKKKEGQEEQELGPGAPERKE